MTLHGYREQFSVRYSVERQPDYRYDVGALSSRGEVAGLASFSGILRL